MASRLFNVLGAGNAAPNNMLEAFKRFRSQFQGDPKQKIQELLNSGQMTQQQFEALRQRAQQLTELLK